MANSSSQKDLQTWIDDQNVRFATRAEKDPGIPDHNPQCPFTHGEPLLRDIESIKSDGPKRVTHVIIGSGITGCSVAHALLKHEAFNQDSVLVIEAGTLASGGTGSSAGQLATATWKDWGDLKKQFGVEKATEAAHFSHNNLERLEEIAKRLPKEVQDMVQFRRVTTVTNFMSRDIQHEYDQYEREFRKACPELADRYTKRDASYVQENFRIVDTHGALESPGATLKPGKLVAAIFKQLMEDYPDRFSIQTGTHAMGVHSCIHPEYPYIIITSNRRILAKNAILCTNGWSRHLLPECEGKIFNTRTAMTEQALDPEPRDESGQYSWKLVDKPAVDYKSGIISPGTYSLMQDPWSNHFYLGGGSKTWVSMLDNSSRPPASWSTEVLNLNNLMPTIFRTPANEALDDWIKVERRGSRRRLKTPDRARYDSEMERAWAGHIGFTPDLQPLVGQLEICHQGRKWIAAGCNGQGLDKCWLMGEGLVRMMAGEKDDYLPQCYRVTEDRLKGLDAMQFLSQWLAGRKANDFVSKMRGDFVLLKLN